MHRRVLHGMIFTGTATLAGLRGYASDTGERLLRVDLNNFGATSGAVAVDGRLVLGSGVGERSEDPSNPGTITAGTASPIRAFCIAGNVGCADGCSSAQDSDGDACDDSCPDLGVATRIASISSDHAAPGSAVTIHGGGFGPKARVWFGPVEANVEAISPTSIRATVPQMFGTDVAYLRVSNPEGCGSTQNVSFQLAP